MEMSEERSGKRCSNFTNAEEQSLVGLVNKYKNVIECKKSGASTWKLKDDTWKKIHEEFIARSGKFRTIKNLKEKYLNLKKKTKRKFSQQKQYMKGTGGGPAENVEITEVDQTIKEMIEEQVTGLSNTYDSDVVFLSANPVIEVNELGDNTPKKGVIIHDIITNSDANLLEQNPSCSSMDVQDEIQTAQNCLLNASNTLEKPSEEAIQTWETYSSNDLKRKPQKKLRTNMVRTTKSDKMFLNLNHQLIQEKIDFVRTQQEKFLEEHQLRMTLLRKQLENEELKKEQLINNKN